MRRYTLPARYGQPCFWGEECFLKTILQQARSALTRSKDTAAEKEAPSPDSAKYQSAAAAATPSAGSAQQATAHLNALLGAADRAALQAQTPEQTELVGLPPQTTVEVVASSELIEGKTVTESVTADSQELLAAAALAATTATDTSETVTTTTTTTTTATNTIQQFYPVVVSTPAELAAAHKAGAKKILVKGELASKLETAFGGLRSLSSASLNALALVLSGAALLAPFTGGVSLGAAGTVMGTLGAALTATAIAAISAIGLSLVVAVFKGYDEIKLAGGGVELRLKKHVPKAEKQATETEAAAPVTVADTEVKTDAAAKAENKAHELKPSEAKP